VLELLLALSLVLVITAGAVSVALSSRGLYQADQARTRLNQNLRAARDYLAADVRQAGERLGDDFPVLEIVDGIAGAPDELLVRRNLEDVVLRVCRDVGASDTEVYIGEPAGPPPPGCAAAPDSDADGWPDNLQTWRERRLASGSALQAYIYDPVTGDGEFFLHDGEDKDELVLLASAAAWQHTYPLASNCRVYLLEERRYRLAGGLLQLVVNDDDFDAQQIVDSLEDLQATALFQDGTQQASLGHGDAWPELRAVRIVLAGRIDLATGEPIERTSLLEIVPRNVLSN
jgi:type IV pilus assembly protein PilW